MIYASNSPLHINALKNFKIKHHVISRVHFDPILETTMRSKSLLLSNDTMCTDNLGNPVRRLKCVCNHSETERAVANCKGT